MILFHRLIKNFCGPVFWLPLQTQLDKVVKLGGEGSVVGVSPRRRGRLSVCVQNPARPRTLADSGVGPGAGRLQGQLLRRDGGGVQQTRNRPVEFLQKHLWEANRSGLGEAGPRIRRVLSGLFSPEWPACL